MGVTRKIGMSWTAWIGAGLLTTSVIASAQDPKIATAQDVIVARKALMTTLSDSFDQIEAAVAAGKLNLDEGKDRADAISVMFMVFPHLFPTASNQWKAGADLDPATDTFASPDVWSKYEDFYKRAGAASKAAYTMSRAEKDDDFKAAAKELRADCNACHDVYLKQ
jgi:cytochrome c556